MMKQNKLICWHWRGINSHHRHIQGYSYISPTVLRHQLWQQSRIQVQHIRRSYQRNMTQKQWQQWHYRFTLDWLSLLQSGVSQLASFDILSTQARHRQIYVVLQNIIRSLHQGHSLHHSISHSQGHFSWQYCRLIEAGEYSGQLIPVLERLVMQIKARIDRQKMIRKALTYPAIVIATACLVVMLMLYLVVPQFALLYEQMDAPLPESTTRLLSLADALLSPLNWFWALLFLPIIGLLRLLQYWMGKYTMLAHTIYLIPFFGSICRTLHLERDIRVFTLATDSQLVVTDACRLCALSSSSAVLQKQWQITEQHVKNGSTLTQAIQHSSLLNEEDIQRIEIGEQSGQISIQLHAITERLESTLNQFQHRILTSLEPLLLMITGIICGSILLALYTPLFQISQLVG